MNIYEVIEECHLDHNTSDAVITAIIKNYSDELIDNLTNKFLRGIGNKSQVNGKVVETLWGISDYYREHRELTQKQKFYILGRIIVNWDQMSCESRAHLML
jgi:hypothetical protein